MWHATVDSRSVVIKSLTAPVWKIQSSAQLLCSCSVWCTWWHFHFPLQCRLAKEKTIAAYHTCVVAIFLPFYSSLSRFNFFIVAFLIFLSVSRMVVEGNLFSFIYPKLKVLSVFALTQIVPNLYGFLSLKFWRVVLIALFHAVTMNEDWSFQISKKTQNTIKLS